MQVYEIGNKDILTCMMRKKKFLTDTSTFRRRAYRRADFRVTY